MSTGIEITVSQDMLSLGTEVMTLRDALNACRSSNDGSDAPTDDSSSSDIGRILNCTEDDAEVPDALYSKGATPLFKAIEEVNWREALRITNEFPEQVRTWVKSTGTESTTFDWSLWRRLPIHEACRRQAPAWMVSALLSAYPKSAFCTTQFDELPLHLAVGCGAAPEVVNLIVLANWEGCVAHDKSGRTPLEVWNESELLIDEDHKVVFDSLTRCQETYTRIQSDWQTKVDTLKKENEDSVTSLRDRHSDAMKAEEEKQMELELEINKLYDTVEILTSGVQEKEQQITTFASAETMWIERVNTLKGQVSELEQKKAEEEENVEALHHLVEEKDKEIKSLTSKVHTLTKDLQQVMTWYNKTEDGLAKTQRHLQKMVDSYVEIHGKLTDERQGLKDLMTAHRVDLPPRMSPPPPPPPPPKQHSPNVMMDAAANAVAKAANAALARKLIGDPD